MNDTSPDIERMVAARYAIVKRLYGSELPEAALLAHAQHSGDP